jgi:hypothetical protein
MGLLGIHLLLVVRSEYSPAFHNIRIFYLISSNSS